MIVEQEKNDAQANRKARSAVEKAMFACISASLVASPALIYLERTRMLFSDRFLDIASFFPERIFLGAIPEIVKVVMLVSNAATILYLLIHLTIMKREIIRNDFQRQDRKNLLWVICAIFYFLRISILYLLSRDGVISVAVVILPALTIISISTALISLSTVGCDARASELT